MRVRHFHPGVDRDELCQPRSRREVLEEMLETPGADPEFVALTLSELARLDALEALGLRTTEETR